MASRFHRFPVIQTWNYLGNWLYPSVRPTLVKAASRATWGEGENRERERKRKEDESTQASNNNDAAQ